MAGIGAGVTSKALGEAIFGQPKLKTVYGNKRLGELQENEYPDLLRSFITSGKNATTDFTNALNLGTPEATRLQAEDIANLGAMTKEGLAFDPLRYYNEILNAKVGGPSGIKSFIPDLLGAQNANLARNRLRLGINGSGPTTYDSVASLAALGNSLAPILGGIYANTGAEAAGAAGARLANIGSTVGLMRERAGIPDRLANRALLPFKTEADILGQQFGLAGQLGDITKANIQGHQLKSNPWANLMAATGEATDSAVDTGMDLAKMYFGGGMMGGLGGAMGGMGGGASAGAPPAGYQIPQNFGYFQPQSGGYGAQTFAPQTYSPPPQYGMLGPGSLGGYNYAPAPSYSYAPPPQYSQFGSWF